MHKPPPASPAGFFSSFDTLELTPGSSSAGLELKHERSLRHLRAFAPVDSPTKTKQGRIRGAMLGERSHDPWRLQWDLRRHHHAAPAVPSRCKFLTNGSSAAKVRGRAKRRREGGGSARVHEWRARRISLVSGKSTSVQRAPTPL